MINLTINNNHVDESKRQENCPNCGSTTREPKHSHYHCSDCGWQLDQLEFSPSFAPTNNDPNGLKAKAIGHSRNGTTLSVNGGQRGRRLARTHSRATRERPRFLDEIVGEIVRSCGISRAAADATRLLIQVNQANPIGNRRKKMTGCADMSYYDAKQYRTRVYAAAALHILNDDGQQNTSRHLSRDWAIDFRDLVGTIRFLNSHRRRLLNETPSIDNRPRKLRQEIATTRDYLIQLVGCEKANQIYATSIKILKSELELIDDKESKIGVGKFMPHSPPKAAFMAAVMAMAELGLPRTLVRELHRVLPTTGIGNFVERSTYLFL